MHGGSTLPSTDLLLLSCYPCAQEGKKFSAAGLQSEPGAALSLICDTRLATGSDARVIPAPGALCSARSPHAALSAALPHAIQS